MTCSKESNLVFCRVEALSQNEKSKFVTSNVSAKKSLQNLLKIKCLKYNFGCYLLCSKLNNWKDF